MKNSFMCARCGGTFEKSWSDQAAEEEMVARFGQHSLSVCVIVCDDCYKIAIRELQLGVTSQDWARIKRSEDEMIPRVTT